MIGPGKGRLQTICVLAGMKDFNDGPSLGSTVLTALRAFETAALTF
jgi:hypothetical protein